MQERRQLWFPVDRDQWMINRGADKFRIVIHQKHSATDKVAFLFCSTCRRDLDAGANALAPGSQVRRMEREARIPVSSWNVEWPGNLRAGIRQGAVFSARVPPRIIPHQLW